MGQKFHHRHFNAAIAGVAAAMSLLVGRWSPGRLFDVAWQSYAGIDLSILLQPRHWLLPILLLTVLPLRILRVPARLSSPIRRRNHLFNLMACLFVYLILWRSRSRSGHSVRKITQPCRNSKKIFKSVFIESSSLKL